MKRTRLILVGGFLGAGKTTLLYETSKQLIKNGQRVGLVTNDQAPELVDTALLLHSNLKVEELSGSCFCCNFNGFTNSLKQVKAEATADIIIAEPVGSCTDLSATVIQPLKELMNSEFEVSPLTVLADPVRLEDILGGGTAGLHPSAAYIFLKQLEESDIILITKTDLLKPEDLSLLIEKVKGHYPEHEILTISCKTGEGVETWIKKVLGSNITVQRIVEVNYDRYAEGEAVLGWLNGTVSLHGEQVNWDDYAHNFLKELSRRIDRNNSTIGHIKIMLESGESFIVGNLTGKINTLNFRGAAIKSNDAQMIINARVDMNPQTLDQLVRETLISTINDSITIKTKAWKCLSPGYPNPTHRYKHSIGS